MSAIRTAHVIAAAVLAALLAACGSAPAPVSERSVYESSRAGEHRVREGETLYSIAWRYGVDWNDLARRNGIRAPYTIFPGQRLAIRGTATQRGAIAGEDAAPDAPPARSTSSSATGTTASTASQPPSRPAPSAPAPSWAWPVDGEVVAGFTTSGDVNKGLDIRGASGASIRAAAAGEVVYAGSGLRGWDQLVIVKHDDVWLSAYAHNNALAVKEGQQVSRGAALARIAGGEDRQRLVHFEVRRRGEPVDPRGVLPRR